MTATSTMDRAKQLRAEGLTNEVIAERLQLKIHQIRYMLKPLAKPRGRSNAKTVVTKRMAMEAVNGGVKATAKRYHVGFLRLRTKMRELGLAVAAPGGVSPRRSTREAPQGVVAKSLAAQDARVKAARFLVHRDGVLFGYGPDKDRCDVLANVLGECFVVESGSAEAKAAGL